MREIKFRGKCIKTGNLIFGSLISFDEQCKFIFQGHEAASTSSFADLVRAKMVMVEPSSVAQYTNQKNHEDIEIYEGDYVSKELDNGFDYGEFEGIVELIDGKWVINNRVNHYEELFTEIEQIEILGNVYDNPELLKRIETISN